MTQVTPVRNPWQVWPNYNSPSSDVLDFNGQTLQKLYACRLQQTHLCAGQRIYTRVLLGRNKVPSGARVLGSRGLADSCDPSVSLTEGRCDRQAEGQEINANGKSGWTAEGGRKRACG